MLITINDARTLILSGQCLMKKEKNHVVQVVSDLDLDESDVTSAETKAIKDYV